MSNNEAKTTALMYAGIVAMGTKDSADAKNLFVDTLQDIATAEWSSYLEHMGDVTHLFPAGVSEKEQSIFEERDFLHPVRSTLEGREPVLSHGDLQCRMLSFLSDIFQSRALCFSSLLLKSCINKQGVPPSFGAILDEWRALETEHGSPVAGLFAVAEETCKQFSFYKRYEDDIAKGRVVLRAPAFLGHYQCTIPMTAEALEDEEAVKSAQERMKKYNFEQLYTCPKRSM